MLPKYRENQGSCPKFQPQSLFSSASAFLCAFWQFLNYEWGIVSFRQLKSHLHFLFSKISSFFSPFFNCEDDLFIFDFRSSLNIKRLGLFLLKITNIFPYENFFALLLFVGIFCFYLLCAIFIVKSIIFIAWGFWVMVKKALHFKAIKEFSYVF